MDIKKECDLVIEELSRFSKELITFGPPITDDRLAVFAKHIGFGLPTDFSYFLGKFNGISLMGTEILGLAKELRESSLDAVYQFEHYEAGHKMPPQFLPFSPDGYGNHYCLNLAKLKNDLCPVIFWQYDLDYNSIDDVEECNENLISWVKEVVIEWTLEDYDYDGNEK